MPKIHSSNNGDNKYPMKSLNITSKSIALLDINSNQQLTYKAPEIRFDRDILLNKTMDCSAIGKMPVIVNSPNIFGLSLKKILKKRKD